MKKLLISTVGLIVCSCVGSAFGTPITYDVAINTSSITGTTGSLDFNFNPGPFITQSASLNILSFAGDGTAEGPPSLTGDISGALPSTLTFTNGTSFNDYFEAFTFGSSLNFAVSLYGPALVSPDGLSTSGSAFAFSMYSDSAGTMPVLTSDTTDGFAFTITVNLDGTTTVNNFTPDGTVTPTSATVPEPADLLVTVLSGICFAALLIAKKRFS